jgi:hypothetical protein
MNHAGWSRVLLVLFTDVPLYRRQRASLLTCEVGQSSLHPVVTLLLRGAGYQEKKKGFHYIKAGRLSQLGEAIYLFNYGMIL